ncbi:MAG TPA: hypothetical protein P5337_14765, partial [Aestuariivirga sp.]|nr:hypothetical protein [Aestuariivirga sp.]
QQAKPVQKPTASAHLPQAQRPAKPPRDRHPARDVGEAPDAMGFHAGNMPSFLMRPVKIG